MQRAFELYILRQQDWEIESVFEDRDSALASARHLHQTSPRLSLRIVDETFYPESGETSSHIIYQAAGSGREMSDELSRRRSPKSAAKEPAVAEPPAKPKTSFVASVMLRVLGLGAAGFLLLTALSYLPKLLR
jgi:hypothetical protein